MPLRFYPDIDGHMHRELLESWLEILGTLYDRTKALVERNWCFIEIGEDSDTVSPDTVIIFTHISDE